MKEESSSDKGQKAAAEVLKAVPPELLKITGKASPILSLLQELIDPEAVEAATLTPEQQKELFEKGIAAAEAKGDTAFAERLRNDPEYVQVLQKLGVPEAPKKPEAAKAVSLEGAGAEEGMIRERVLGHLPGPAMDIADRMEKEQRDLHLQEGKESRVWERGTYESEQAERRKTDEGMIREQVLGHVPGPAMEIVKGMEKAERQLQLEEGKESRVWERGTYESEQKERREKHARDFEQFKADQQAMAGEGKTWEKGTYDAEQKELKEKEDTRLRQFKEDQKAMAGEGKAWEKGTYDAEQARLKKEDTEKLGQFKADQKAMAKEGRAWERGVYEADQAELKKDHDQKFKQFKEDQKAMATEGRAWERGTFEADQARKKQEDIASRQEPTPLSSPTQRQRIPTLLPPTIPVQGWNQGKRIPEQGYWRTSHEQGYGGGANFPHGRIANRTPSRGLQHPWLIQPFFDAEHPLTQAEQNTVGRDQGLWCVNIVPGFVNGFPPAIKMPMSVLTPDVKVWGNQYGKGVKIDPKSPSLIQVLLTDEPRPFIRLLSFADSRAKVYGADGSVAGGEVPLFFRVRGAKKADPLDAFDVLENIVAAGGDEFVIRLLEGNAPSVVAPPSKDNLPEGNRLLYRADIVLQVDRPALKQSITPDDIGLLRLTGFDVLLPDRTEYSGRLYSVSLYIPPREPTLADVLAGDYQEPTIDEVVIGTLWLLSPVETLLQSNVPDGSWMPFVRNEVFWNLNYASITQIDPVPVDQSLEYFKQILAVLGTGAGYLVALSYVNQDEANYNTILTAYNQSAVKGQFWTG
jgi:hypothetical protein